MKGRAVTNAGARRRRLGTKIDVADFSAPAIATDADYQFSTTTKPYRFVSLENLPVHLALVVIPDLAARPRKDGLDRQQKAHLLRLEDPTLWIDERDALSP